MTTNNILEAETPVTETTIVNEENPAEQTVQHLDPLNNEETIVQAPGIPNATSTYVSPTGRTTVIQNDLDVKSRVELKLQDTRARLGTQRVFTIPHNQVVTNAPVYDPLLKRSVLQSTAATNFSRF